MLSIIVAIAENNVIGKDGKLIWHIPRDLKHFREITDGSTIIMGRKTFESLPGVLPNRRHVVLTRNKDFRVDHPEVLVIHSLEEIQPYIDSEEEAFIIGGGELFRLMLPHATRLYLTWIGKSWDGDTYFPESPSDEFMLTEEWEAVDEKTGIQLNFANYDRVESDLEEKEWEEELENSRN